MKHFVEVYHLVLYFWRAPIKILRPSGCAPLKTFINVDMAYDSCLLSYNNIIIKQLYYL